MVFRIKRTIYIRQKVYRCIEYRRVLLSVGIAESSSVLLEIECPEILPIVLPCSYSIAHWCHQQSEHRRRKKMEKIFHYFYMCISVTLFKKLNFSDDFLGCLVQLVDSHWSVSNVSTPQRPFFY